MPVPTFTAPPPAPNRSDPPDVFIVKSNAFVAWFSPFEAELEVAVGWMNSLSVQMAADAATVSTAATDVAAAASAVLTSTSYVASSASNLTVGTGSKTVVLQQSGKTFAVNDVVLLVSRSQPDTIRMGGSITAIAGTTLTVSIPANGVVGSGSASDWVVILGVFAATPALAADLLKATSSLLAISPKSVKDSYAPATLIDAATVTPNGQLGLDFKWTIGGNRTLAAITNTYPGARGTIEITQDGTGSRILAVASAWKRAGGLAVLSTAAGAIDEIQYEVKTVDGSNTATRIVYGLIRNPT